MRYSIKIIFFILLIVFNSILNGAENNKFSVENTQCTDTKFYVLFVTLTYDFSDCVSLYIKNSIFSKFIEYRSINFDITRTQGKSNISLYESLIKEKIKQGNYKFIIIVDESKIISNEFVEYLNENFFNKYIIIGFKESNDIFLSIDFNNFFQVVRQLTDLNKFDVYFLFNSFKNNNIYISNLKSINTVELNVIPVQITYQSEVTVLLNKLKKSPGSIVISNLHYMIEDITGSIIKQKEISEYISSFTSPISLIIETKACHLPKSAFSIIWGFDHIVDVVDSFIVKSRNNVTFTKYILSSELSINLTLSKTLFKSIPNDELHKILEYMDNITYGTK
jgi:hypothetical protein